MSAGMVQNLGGPVVAHTLEGVKQTIAQGPVASQEAIKLLGTNGGGFFNANSAHPFENPTPLTNFVEVLAFLSIPAGLTYTFGRYAGNQRQGWALFAGDGDYLRPVPGRHDLERPGRQPEHRQRRREPGRDVRPVGRQHGGQGGALRHLRLRALRERDHRHLLRRRQRLRWTA